MIIRFITCRKMQEEYNWCIPGSYPDDNWVFRSSLPTGRQASSVFPAFRLAGIQK
jgi:hypothetical protein